MKTKPQIGIVGWKTGDNSFGSTIPYLNHLSHFGDVQVLTPMEGIVETLDLVVLPGGKDMPSFLYGKTPHWSNSDSDQFKEFFVQQNLSQYIDRGIPVWGTCLGFQQLIVKFGGELCQSIPYSHGYSSEHRGELVHDLIFTGPYKDIEAKLLVKNKAKVIKANSLHHQGAYIDMVPDCFDVVCHTKDKMAEIIKHKTLPIAGYQGHVEEDFNPVAMLLISRLIKQSPNYENENTSSSGKLSDTGS